MRSHKKSAMVFREGRPYGHVEYGAVWKAGTGGEESCQDESGGIGASGRGEPSEPGEAGARQQAICAGGYGVPAGLGAGRQCRLSPRATGAGGGRWGGAPWMTRKNLKNKFSLSLKQFMPYHIPQEERRPYDHTT